MFIKLWQIARILAAGMVSLGLLSLFTLCYKFTPPRQVTPNGATDYKWPPHSRLNTMEEGFAFLRTDSRGYNNLHPKSQQTPIDILLMGSSHMLAVEIPQNENVGYLLNQGLPYTTYNIGMAGHFIYTSVANLQTAVSLFAPRKYVIIQTDTLFLRPGDMQLVLDDKLPEVESKTGSLITWAQRIFPAIKKLAIQFSAWKSAGAHTGKKDTVTRPAASAQLWEQYFAKIERSAPGVKVILVYNPKTVLDKNGNIADNRDAPQRKMAAALSQRHHILFLDMTDDFRDLYLREHILAHGFANTSVGGGHLNKYGHKTMAQALTKLILEDSVHGH